MEERQESPQPRPRRGHWHRELAMLSFIARFVTQDEDGQSLAEYAVILSLIMVVCVAAMTALGAGIVTTLLEPAAAMF
jgi:Flp pilus assembly pilin Flp